MKKVMLMVLCTIAMGIFTACGGSEQGCVNQCAMSFSKSSTLCGAQHGRLSREGNQCSKLALQENDQCAARCYGM